MPEVRPGDLVPRSPSRAVRMQEYVDGDGITRYKMLTADMKLDDETKRVFIEEFAEHGRMGTAARKSGVTMVTIRRHIEKDPEFGSAVAEALECYKDRLLGHHQNLVFNGVEKTNYDRNGNIVSTETIYPIRLIELELKKHDEGYRDRKDVTVQVKGGVLVAPAEVSMEEWAAKFGAAPVGDIVDATIVNDIGEDEMIGGED